jgi:CelD/BcsL family acetyltransferase involved in cellulose biosynthesis
VNKALQMLACALADLPALFLHFDGIPLDEPRWKGLLVAMRESGLSIDVREQHRIGQVSIRDEWSVYESRLSRNHRRNRCKQERLLEQFGGARLRIYSEFSEHEVISLLRKGFEVEDRSWKGREGTSVLRSPGIFEFFCKEAVCLAKEGALELVFLEHGGEPIAFLYGWKSKGIRYTPKVGFDEAYQRFGPGQQLMMQFIRYLHEEQPLRKLDFHGPLMPWTESWATESYAVSRIVSTTKHPLSRSLFRLNFELKPRLKQLKGRNRGVQ